MQKNKKLKKSVNENQSTLRKNLELKEKKNQELMLQVREFEAKIRKIELTNDELIDWNKRKKLSIFRIEEECKNMKKQLMEKMKLQNDNESLKIRVEEQQKIIEEQQGQFERSLQALQDQCLVLEN